MLSFLNYDYGQVFFQVQGNSVYMHKNTKIQNNINSANTIYEQGYKMQEHRTGIARQQDSESIQTQEECKQCKQCHQLRIRQHMQVCMVTQAKVQTHMQT